MPACLQAGSYALGLFFIFLVSCSWAGASVLIQYIYKDLAFDSPFIITYVCTSLFGIYLPWVYTCSRLGCGHNPPLTDDGVAATPLPTTEPPQEPRGLSTDNVPLKLTTDEQEERSTATPPAVWSHARTIRVARVICPLWFVANFSYNVSLAMTSVTSNTIISTTSSLWTFLFSTFYGLEGFSWVKLGGLVLSFLGTVLVGVSDQGKGGNGTDSVLGDALCLFSAIMYGVYTTALRILVPDESVMSFQLLFGYIGVLNALLLFPILLILINTAPQVTAGLSWSILGLIVLNGLCDNVVSDYLWARAIVLTSPAVATVGLSLTIPLAFLSDALLGHPRTGALEVLGALGVVLGFLLVIYRGRDNNNNTTSRAQAQSSGQRRQGGAGEEGTQLERPTGGERERGPSTASDGRLLSQL